MLKKFLQFLRFFRFLTFNRLGFAPFPDANLSWDFSRRDPETDKMVALKIPDQQAFRKIYHASDFGVQGITFNPKKYRSITGDTYAEVLAKQIKYLETVMTPEQLEAYCQNLLIFGTDDHTEIREGLVFDGGNSSKEVYFIYSRYERDTRALFFYQNTGNLWSGWNFSKDKFDRIVKDGILFLDGPTQIINLLEKGETMDSEFDKISAFDYDYERYCQLSEKGRQLREENKCLFDEDRVSWYALGRYYGMIENQVFYNSRLKYLKVLRQNQEKQSTSIWWGFWDIYKEDRAFLRNLAGDLETLSHFEVSPNSDGFMAILDQLLSIDQAFMECDPPIVISKEKLDEYLTKIISKLESYP